MNKQSTNLTHIYFPDKIKRPTLQVKETKGNKKKNKDGSYKIMLMRMRKLSFTIRPLYTKSQQMIDFAIDI